MLEIIYRDDALIAVHKPAGLHTHGSELSPREDNLMRRLRKQTGCWLWPVHRLDRGASGLVLFALSKDAARILAAQFAERRVKKEYLVLVRGWTDPQFQVDRALSDPDLPDVLREASSHFECLHQGETELDGGSFPTMRVSLLRCKPSTGRPHQLRRHLAGKGWPILGDRRHGDHQLAKGLAAAGLLKRLALVCTSLRFQHPTNHEELHLRAGLDQEFRGIFEACALSLPEHVSWQQKPARGRVLFECDTIPLCPLCGQSCQPFHLGRDSRFFDCPDCGLVHRDEKDWPDPEREEARYREHRNNAEDPGYRRWLQPACDWITRSCRVGSRGLDVGCGPSQLLAGMLSEKGLPCRGWDPIFHSEPEPEAGAADFLTFTEVFEHLHDPLKTMKQLDLWCRPGGHILIMTGKVNDKGFADWHYIRDDTHVLFARARTMNWIAERMGWKLLAQEGTQALFCKA